MKKLMLTSLIALALGSVNTASAFGLGDLAGAVGGAKANAAAAPSVTAGDLDSFINAAKEADALISSSADSLFKNTQPKADVAAHNQKVLAANNLTDPAKREEMKQIMRWAGPRMLWRHPILTIRHLIDDRRPVPALPEKYRPKKSR